MSRKENKFYVINISDPRIIFFLKKIFNTRAMKTHIQKSYKDGKCEGRRYVQGLQMDPNNSLTDVQVHLFFLNDVLC